MKSITRGNIKTAFSAVRRNKGRSTLTMLGIIIGVASVVTIVSIGEGVKTQVNTQINHLGRNLIMVRPGQLLSRADSGSLGSIGSLTSLNVSGALGDRDVKTVRQTPGVAEAVPLSIVGGGVTTDEHQPYSALVIGTTEGLPQILNQPVEYGAFFSDDDTATNKVVIGAHVAEELFDQNVPLGQILVIRGQQFVVSGIFSTFDTAPLSVDTDFNNAVFIPYSSAQQITDNNSLMYEILARPRSSDQTDQVVDGLKRSLLASHGGQHDFTVLKQDQTLAVTNGVLNLLTAMIGGVAAISLLVGGIGVMNVMLVSVTERMHEIGIRKAIGATNRQILNQFITEATVLSVTGGLIGVALSFLIEIILRLFTNLQPSITWQIVLAASVVSIGVGVIFGSAPALKAARKDPISALRNE